MAFLWTDENIERLRVLWGMGLSAYQVAQRLDGPSRSAVLGKVHRLGLSNRTTTNRKKPGPRKPRQPKEKPSASTGSAWSRHIALRAIAPDDAPLRPAPNTPREKRKTIIEVEAGECRFIFDDDGKCCAQKAVTGLSWCEAHAALVFAPPVPTRRETQRVKEREIA